MSTETSRPATYLITLEGVDAAEKAQRLNKLAQEMGGVTLTGLAGVEAEWFGLPLEEQQRQRLLDTFVTEVLPGFCPPVQLGDISRRLARGLVRSVRDVLALGTVRTASLAGLTALQLDRLANAVKVFYPGETLLAKPTPTEIAGVCFDLGQVHASVLRHYQQNQPYDRSSYRGMYLTVADFLADELVLPEGFVMPDRADSVVIKAEARRFAAEFSAAREASHVG